MNTNGYRAWEALHSPKGVTLLLGLAAVFAFLAVVLIGNSGVVTANDALEAVTQVDCDPDQVYSDPGDAAAAQALEDAGYTCTALLNKGQLPSTFQQVGELWHLTDGTQHMIRIIWFGGDNTGFVDSKICLDDDPDPINNIAPGGPDPASCLGNEVPNTNRYQQGVDGGPSYPPAKAADVDPEEAAGQFEIAIIDLVEISELFGGTTVGGWNINIDDYTEALPHFNKDGFSVVSYYQPNPKTNIKVTKSDSPDPLYLGDTLTYTLLVENTTQVPAANVTLHDDLPAEVTFVSATPSQGTCGHDGVNPNGEVDCELGTIGAFGTATVTIVVTVTSDVAECNTTFTNVVSVSTTTEETTLEDNSDSEDTTIECGALRIEKRSTESGNPLVSNAGAVFSYDSSSVTDNGAGDEDPTVGVMCVSGLETGEYTVGETTPPPGYGAGTAVDDTATVVAGTDCTTNQPSAADSAVFTNPPLGALRIEKRSTESGNPLVSNAGAVFSYDSSSVTDNGAGDEDPTVGVMCVSGLETGEYTVGETTPPPGYGAGTAVDDTATVVAGTDCTTNQPSAADSAVFTNPPLEVFEGCTPGFWKNHLESWAATGYSPDQTLESVFDVPDSLGMDNKTLLQALDFGGGAGVKGAAQILLRAAVAGLLNSAHPDVNYTKSTAELIAAVNAALASNDRNTMLTLASEIDADNNAGCPIDGQGE